MENLDKKVEELARKAGAYAMTESGKIVVDSKNNDYRDVVTNIDIEISDLLKGEIAKIYPDDNFYSEEDQAVVNSEIRTWIIDPIDGTSNYARSLPLYSSCVTVLQHNAVVSSAIFCPTTNECCTLSSDKVQLNGSDIQVAGTQSLKDTYVNFHPGRKKEHRAWAGETKVALLGSAKKSINTGSSALDLCYLACGRVDIVIYGTLTTLDVSGAVAMVRRAGGEVYNYDTKQPVEFSNDPQRIIATVNPELLESYFSVVGE